MAGDFEPVALPTPAIGDPNDPTTAGREASRPRRFDAEEVAAAMQWAKRWEGSGVRPREVMALVYEIERLRAVIRGEER